MCTHIYTHKRKRQGGREIKKHRERCRETNTQRVRETKRERENASFYVEAESSWVKSLLIFFQRLLAL